MGKWHTFEVRKDEEIPFFELRDQVNAWLENSCKKRYKVILMQSRDRPETRDLVMVEKWGPTPGHHLKVMLKGKADAALFRMFFGDYQWVDVAGIIVPLIRRVMPTIIAADICGVQPMTGPTALIHSLRVKYQKPASALVQPAQSSGKREAMSKVLEDTRRFLEKQGL